MIKTAYKINCYNKQLFIIIAVRYTMNTNNTPNALVLLNTQN